MITLEQVGTFDVENYGDLLYPVLFRHIVEGYEARVRVRAYSFLGGKAPQDAGFETIPLRSLFDRAASFPSRIVIGGGDILRTDWDRVAEPYGAAHSGQYTRLLRTLGPVKCLGYLLRERLFPLAAKKFYGTHFKSRWMNHAGPGPFLIDPDYLSGESIVSYLSCGVPHEFDASERDKVSRTFEKAVFIYLRDEQSREKLRRAGVSSKVHVAPDLIVTLSDYVDHAPEARLGRAILSGWGVDCERPLLCFQSKPNPQFSDDEIIDQLQRYHERTGSEIVLLPIGLCHGDHEFLRRLAEKAGGTLKYVGVHSIYEIIRVIAASNMFIGTSLHGNITAFSFGIPHLYGPLPVDKAEGFLSVVNLPPELKLGTWNEMNDKIDMITVLGEEFFSKRAREAKARVYRATNELLDNLLK